MYKNEEREDMEELFVRVMFLLCVFAVIAIVAMQEHYKTEKKKYKKRMINLIKENFNEIQVLEERVEEQRVYANRLNIGVKEMLDREKEMEEELLSTREEKEILREELELARMEAEWYREQLKKLKE